MSFFLKIHNAIDSFFMQFPLAENERDRISTIIEEFAHTPPEESLVVGVPIIARLKDYVEGSLQLKNDEKFNELQKGVEKQIYDQELAIQAQVSLLKKDASPSVAYVEKAKKAFGTIERFRLANEKGYHELEAILDAHYISHVSIQRIQGYVEHIFALMQAYAHQEQLFLRQSSDRCACQCSLKEIVDHHVTIADERQIQGALTCFDENTEQLIEKESELLAARSSLLVDFSSKTGVIEPDMRFFEATSWKGMQHLHAVTQQGRVLVSKARALFEEMQKNLIHQSLQNEAILVKSARKETHLAARSAYRKEKGVFPLLQRLRVSGRVGESENK